MPRNQRCCATHWDGERYSSPFVVEECSARQASCLLRGSRRPSEVSRFRESSCSARLLCCSGVAHARPVLCRTEPGVAAAAASPALYRLLAPPTRAQRRRSRAATRRVRAQAVAPLCSLSRPALTGRRASRRAPADPQPPPPPPPPQPRGEAQRGVLRPLARRTAHKTSNSTSRRHLPRLPSPRPAAPAPAARRAAPCVWPRRWQTRAWPAVGELRRWCLRGGCASTASQPRSRSSW